MKDPCYGCTERTATCHIDCERYIKAKRERDERSKIIRKNKDQYRHMYEYYADVSERLNKKYHK